MTDPVPYPEHEKLRAVKTESQAIGHFIEEGPYTLAEWGDPDKGSNPNRLYPVHRPINDILAEHFGIDLKVLEQEKRSMLESLRS